MLPKNKFPEYKFNLNMSRSVQVPVDVFEMKSQHAIHEFPFSLNKFGFPFSLNKFALCLGLYKFVSTYKIL